MVWILIVSVQVVWLSYATGEEKTCLRRYSEVLSLISMAYSWAIYFFTAEKITKFYTMCGLMENIVKTSIHLGVYLLLVSADFTEKPIEIKLLLRKK